MEHEENPNWPDPIAAYVALEEKHPELVKAVRALSRKTKKPLKEGSSEDIGEVKALIEEATQKDFQTFLGECRKRVKTNK